MQRYVSLDAGSPYILAGPTMAGKSGLAAAAAATKALNAEIIPADKYYPYAGPDFMLGLGLEPKELEDGSTRHIYGSRAPEDPVLTPEEYLARVIKAVDEAHARGRNAVIEGCSYSYLMAAIGHFGIEHAVRITWDWADKWSIGRLAGESVVDLVGRGLLDETRRALEAGYEHTFPMTSLLYKSAVRVVRGELPPDAGVRQMRADWISEALRTDLRLSEVPDLLTITSSELRATAPSWPDPL